MKQQQKQPADFFAKQFDKEVGTKKAFQNNFVLRDIFSSGIYQTAKYPQEAKQFGMIIKRK